LITHYIILVIVTQHQFGVNYVSSGLQQQAEYFFRPKIFIVDFIPELKSFRAAVYMTRERGNSTLPPLMIASSNGFA
jgi:hypothetical protein